jgi:hypothetical protein
MIPNIVKYLYGARVPFRLSSYPSEEPLPKPAHPMPPSSMRVETEIVLVEGRLVLACYAAGESIDYAALTAMLGGVAVPGNVNDLPPEFRNVQGPLPALGGFVGATTVIDEGVVCGVLEFQAFDGNDFFDVPWDDWARVEAPRFGSFASAGELPEETSAPSTSRGAEAPAAPPPR